MERRSLLLSGALLAIFLCGILLHKPILRQLIARKIKRALADSKYKALFPYILAQSKVETANFTSRLCVEDNNLFGMKNATRREQLGREIEGLEFRKYGSYTESVEDFILLLNYGKFPATVDGLKDYVQEMKRRDYFEATESEYLELMQAYYER